MENKYSKIALILAFLSFWLGLGALLLFFSTSHYYRGSFDFHLLIGVLNPILYFIFFLATLPDTVVTGILLLFFIPPILSAWFIYKAHKHNESVDYARWTVGFLTLFVTSALLSVFFSFSVLQPQGSPPHPCQISAEFQCHEFRVLRVTDTQMIANISLINQLGGTIELNNSPSAMNVIARMYDDSPSWTATNCAFSPAMIPGGQMTVLTCNFTAPANTVFPPAGEKVKLAANFTYTEEGKSRSWPGPVQLELLATIR